MLKFKKVLFVLVIAMLAIVSSACDGKEPELPFTHEGIPSCKIIMNNDVFWVTDGEQHPSKTNWVCDAYSNSFVKQENTNAIFIETTPEPTITVKNETTVIDNQNPIAFAQAETCVGILPLADQNYVEKTLVPGQTFAGDIEIFVNNEWIKVHDDGIGEYTVVRNIGATDILTRGRWGAGCLLEVNQMIVVNGEFENPNHSDLVRVRDVAVDGKSYVETMFTSPLQ